MILLDFSDTSAKALRIAPRLFKGAAITAFAKRELKPGVVEKSEIQDGRALEQEVRSLLEKAVPAPLKDQEVAFVLHDERTFTLRLNLPAGKADSSLVEAEIQRVAQFLPVPISSLATAIAGPQFAAVDQKLLTQYLDLFKKLGLKTVLATPESQAVFALLASHLKAGEVSLFLDLGGETTDVVILDNLGVLQTFTETVETPQLVRGVANVVAFTEEKFGKSPTRIFLGGGGAVDLDQEKFAAAVQRKVTSVEDILKTLPLKLAVDFGPTRKLGFTTLFGLALLVKQKDPINFVSLS